MNRGFSPVFAVIAAAGIVAAAFALRAADDQVKEGATGGTTTVACSAKADPACSAKAKSDCGDKTASECSGTAKDDCNGKTASACTGAKAAGCDSKAAACGDVKVAANTTLAVEPDGGEEKECCGGDGCAEGGDKACCKEKADKACCAAKLGMAHPAFEAVKALAGEWRSADLDNDGRPDVVVTYRVTSGGTAVLETLFPGTEQEMITVYTADSEYIWATHYCLLGNQPRLKARPGEGDLLAFEFVDAGNLKSTAATHMNSLRLMINGDDSIVAEWGSATGGQPNEPHKFVLTRSRIQG